MNPKGVLESLVEQLMQLPGVGKKTGERFAFFILRMPADAARKMATAILDAKEKLFFCKICHNMTEEETCRICLSSGRDHLKILVVEEVNTLCAIEKSGEYKGLYHVLHGTCSPLSNNEEGQAAIKSLIERVRNGTDAGTIEVILATSPNIEGEATALYVTRLLKPLGIKVTRIACGVPAGSDIEYADEVTLVKSLQGRQEVFS